MQQRGNELGYLGLLGFLGFLGHLGAVLNRSGLYWLYLLHLLFLLFGLFRLPKRKGSPTSLQALPKVQQSPEPVTLATEAADLGVPIYLNQQIVFDLLAIIEGGFSRLSAIKVSTKASETDKAGMGASIGASNVFALLGVSLSSEVGAEKGLEEQIEAKLERVHTPTSLFAKLRLKLKEQGLLRYVVTEGDIRELAGGEFVESRVVLGKNPLVDTIEGLKQLMEMAVPFAEAAQGQQKDRRRESPSTSIMRQLDGILAALTQSNSIELIGELLDAPGARIVLTAMQDFFGQGGALEMIDGKFRVLGKVVRVVEADSDESINLLRKTTFGRFGPRILGRLADAFDGAEEAGIRFPKLVTEIEGPALQVIPIAIFA